MTVPFRCPHCGEHLSVDGTTSRCPNGHAFDVAKEGYVNLLPGGRLRGRGSGDDDEMVRARRSVFDAGLYAPIIDRVAQIVATAEPVTVLDAGCGEGSYLAAATSVTGAFGVGIDISRAAVRLAARRHVTHRYAVASSYRLPVDDGAFDALINVFSPRSFDEMFRVVRPGGLAVVVTPGPDHLHELKASIYDTVRHHQDDFERGDDIVDDERVTFDVALSDPANRLALLHMTPFWWSATEARRARVADTLDRVTADMQVTIYRSPG